MKKLLLLLLVGCFTVRHSLAQYTTQIAFPSLSFAAPIELLSPDDSTNRLFVASQSGVVRVFANNSAATVSTVFLNISSKIKYSGEMGLLGLAFHPDYKNNGYFYVNYVRASPSLQTVIARYKVSADANVADPDSETILLTFDQPYQNHKGGKLVFGNDGYLYIATGDGGSGGDPLGNGQKHNTLLGKILRIDVDSTANGLNYAIPADNPFIDSTSFRKEIFAYGMRNPWKISVDKPTGTIWAGDVGQGAREEVDIIVKGGNYGWNTMEGFACYSPSQNCKTAGLILPIWDYTHAEGVSITGGAVYRGREMPNLYGKYIYGDFGSGKVWAITYTPGQAPVNTLLFSAGGNIVAFGEDAAHELYICLYSGVIRKIVDPQMPFIQSFSPNHGLSETTVKLVGKNFQASTTGNTVKFGEMEATVTAATTTSLIVTLPGGITPGAVPITVTTNGRTATSGSNFTVDKFPQTIEFDSLPDRTYGDTAITLAASSSSGLPVHFLLSSGPATVDSATNRLTIIGTGLVTIQAEQAGDASYAPAPTVERKFTVNKASQQITWGEIADRIANDPAFSTAPVSSSGLPVSLETVSGSATLTLMNGYYRVTPTGAGTVVLRATQPGNDIFLAAAALEQSFVVQAVTGAEPAFTKQILVFPNPASDWVTVRFEGAAPVRSVGMLLYSALGQVMLTQDFNSTSHAFQTSFNVASLPKGIYQLQVKIGEQTVRKKMIVY